MMDAERLANQLRHEARAAYQAWLDAQLTPTSDAAADATRAGWQPMTDYLKEGPDGGYRQEAESEDCRVN